MGEAWLVPVDKCFCMESVYGAFNYTGAFFWPFAKKITITSISMKNDHFVDFFISFHVGLTYLELFYHTKCFFLQF